jgi:hypothetical protein
MVEDGKLIILMYTTQLLDLLNKANIQERLVFSATMR